MSATEIKVALHDKDLEHIKEVLERIEARQDKHEQILSEFVALRNKGLGSIWVLVLIGGTIGYFFTNWPKIKALF
jgi:hypothetical protein